MNINQDTLWTCYARSYWAKHWSKDFDYRGTRKSMRSLVKQLLLFSQALGKLVEAYGTFLGWRRRVARPVSPLFSPPFARERAFGDSWALRAGEIDRRTGQAIRCIPDAGRRCPLSGLGSSPCVFSLPEGKGNVAGTRGGRIIPANSFSENFNYPPDSSVQLKPRPPLRRFAPLRIVFELVGYVDYSTPFLPRI